jgi:hypothetical protein
MNAEGQMEGERNFHGALERWLDSIATQSEADAVRIHLSDLYGASAKLRALMLELIALDPLTERDKIRLSLTRIDVELYSHILMHIRDLRPGLESWLARLNREVPEDKNV